MILFYLHSDPRMCFINKDIVKAQTLPKITQLVMLVQIPGQAV